MNENYGKREDLPFDLRHKAGPVTYKMKPGASKEEINQERSALVGKLKVALREMLRHAVERATAATPFAATQSIPGDPSRYVPASQVIAVHKGVNRRGIFTP